METIKTNKYLLIHSLSNPKQTYLVDRYAESKLGDKIAVQRGNLAYIENLNDQNKDNHILGKAVSVETKLSKSGNLK